jgi:hypothetical protein
VAAGDDRGASVRRVDRPREVGGVVDRQAGERLCLDDVRGRDPGERQQVSAVRVLTATPHQRGPRLGAQDRIDDQGNLVAGEKGRQ